MDESTKSILDTINNRVAYLFKLNPELRNGSNDDLVEAYREQYDDEETKQGRRAASESITRAWRALKQEGLFQPTDKAVIEAKAKKEKEMREYYGK